jgi:hypothetical protein
MHFMVMRRQYLRYLQVSLSTFSYLFSEIIRYCQDRVDSVPALEQKYVAHVLIVSAQCLGPTLLIPAYDP